MKYKKTLAILGITSGISFLAYQKISDEMFEHVFKKKERDIHVDPFYQNWLDQSKYMNVSVTSFDGFDLKAYDIHNHDDNRYIIMVHGIWANKKAILPRAYEFDKLGYNVLLIDQRASGDSEGEYYTYGFKESMDLTLWINYLVNQYPDVKICLYGLSMGAATVMMSTAYELPSNVCCIAEDCGYSSIREEFDNVLRLDYKLAYTGIVLNLLEHKMLSRFGFGYDDISIKTVLENNEIPILFIHGMDDEFVPFKMSRILYNHNKSEKKYYAVADAKHTESNTDPEYYHNIDYFIKRYM